MDLRIPIRVQIPEEERSRAESQLARLRLGRDLRPGEPISEQHRAALRTLMQPRTVTAEVFFDDDGRWTLLVQPLMEAADQ